MMTLPKRLEKDPLINVIVEFIFSSPLPGPEVLPGYLFSKLAGNNKAIHQLPYSTIAPHAPNTPFTRLEWNQYNINFSDQSISVGREIGDLSWDGFKSLITEILTALRDLEVNPNIERYSVKNINFLPYNNLDDKPDASKLNINFRLANYHLEKEIFHIRTELSTSDFIHIIQIASSASIVFNDTPKKGIIIDVDTVRLLTEVSTSRFLEEAEHHLDALYFSNKTVFFKCLQAQTIQEFGPVYRD